MKETLWYYHDPDGAKWRERDRRIGELMRAAGADGAALGRGYFELVHDNEKAPRTTDFEQLTLTGFELPPASSLDDDALAAKLLDLLDELEKMQVRLELHDAEPADRELYEILLDDLLHREREDIPMAPGSFWVIDVESALTWRAPPDR